MPSHRRHLLALTLLSLAACEQPAADPASPPTETAVTSPASPTLPSLAPQPAAADQAPEAFRGEWSADLSACGGEGNDTRLVIDARRMQFYEGRAEIVAVKPAGAGETVFKMRLSSEGETADVTYRFRLSPDGETLTDVGNGGLARRRCAD